MFIYNFKAHYVKITFSNPQQILQNLLFTRQFKSLLHRRLRFRKPRKSITTFLSHRTLSSMQYRVTPGLDKTRNTTHKNFFHFKVFGFKHCIIKFIVTRAYLLQPFIRVPISQSRNNNLQKVTIQLSADNL